MLTRSLPAALPGSQSELYPAPPSFPWKHGSKGKGCNSSQIHPHPLCKMFGATVPVFCIRQEPTKPYMPLNSSVWPSRPSKWGFL